MGLLDTNSSVDLSCNNVDICLIGGTNALEGSVEMCYNHFWDSVCHLMLYVDNYTFSQLVLILPLYNNSNLLKDLLCILSVILDIHQILLLSCAGSEQSLLDCSYYKNTT